MAVGNCHLPVYRCDSEGEQMPVFAIRVTREQPDAYFEVLQPRHEVTSAVASRNSAASNTGVEDNSSCFLA